jgi:hypothetical protein
MDLLGADFITTLILFAIVPFNSNNLTHKKIEEITFMWTDWTANIRMLNYSKALRCTFLGESKNSCSSKFVQLLLLNRVKARWSENRAAQGFHYINSFISIFFGPNSKTCICKVRAAWGRVSRGLTVNDIQPGYKSGQCKVPEAETQTYLKTSRINWNVWWLQAMAIRVVEFSNWGYKIGKIFA